MITRILPGLTLSLGLAIAACNPLAPPFKPGDSSSKQLKVDYVRLAHPAMFGPNAVKLSGEESQKLAAFLDNAQITADDHVYVEPPSSDKLASQRISQIAHQLATRGIGVRTLPAKTAAPSDQLTVLVERYVVTPPNCPDWTKDPVSDHENELYSNFGCANVTNLGLMVADPRDLVIGRQMGPEEGNPALAGIARYRAGKPKDLISAGSYQAGAGPQNGGGGGGGGGAGAPGGGAGGQ
jgi:pilus assembly protein CpaD